MHRACKERDECHHSRKKGRESIPGKGSSTRNRVYKNRPDPEVWLEHRAAFQKGNEAFEGVDKGQTHVPHFLCHPGSVLCYREGLPSFSTQHSRQPFNMKAFPQPHMCLLLMSVDSFCRPAACGDGKRVGLLAWTKYRINGGGDFSWYFEQCYSEPLTLYIKFWIFILDLEEWYSEDVIFGIKIQLKAIWSF